MLEKDIENKLKKFFKENQIWFLKIHGNSFQTSGVPDLLVCFCGYFIAIEVKRYPNTLSTLQKTHIIEQLHNGGIVIVVDQYNVNELLNNWNLTSINEIAKKSLDKYLKF